MLTKQTAEAYAPKGIRVGVATHQSLLIAVIDVILHFPSGRKPSAAIRAHPGGSKGFQHSQKEAVSSSFYQSEIFDQAHFVELFKQTNIFTKIINYADKTNS